MVGPMPAVGALVEVTAKRGGATPRNGPQHFDMLAADPPAASLDEAVSRSTDEIGNFQYRPVHLLALQQQLVEVGHGNLPATHTYTSNQRNQCSVRPTRSVRRWAATSKRGYRTSEYCDDLCPGIADVKSGVYLWAFQAVSIPGFLAIIRFDSHPVAAAD
jgi:hypothetical protein